MEEGGLRERNRRAAMAAIQAAAVKLMKSAGFGSVTVEQVAESAGVSASTVYRYFGTKESLILWGDRPDRLLDALAASASDVPAGAAFTEAAIAVYTEAGSELLSQLRLVFANEELCVAFEHQLLGRRRDVAAILATRRGSKSAGVRDDAAAGAYLGLLVAILDRWQDADGTKSLTKMLTKADDTLDA